MWIQTELDNVKSILLQQNFEKQTDYQRKIIIKKKNLLTGRKGSENSLTQHMLVNYTGMMCTLSSHKHNVYTVLLVLELGW